MDNKNTNPVNSHATMGVTQEQHADAQNHFAAYMREIGRDKFHPDDISNKAGMWFTYTRDTIHPGKPPEPVKFAPAAREQPTIYDTFKTQTKEQQDFTDYMREISQDKFHPSDISNKARIWDIYSRSTIHPEKTIDTVSKQPTIYDTFKPQTREQLQTPYENANPELNFALKHGISILDPSKKMEAYEKAHLLGLKREKLDLPRGKDGILNLGRIQHDLNKSKNLQHEANMSGAVTDYDSMAIAASLGTGLAVNSARTLTPLGLLQSSGVTASYAAVKELGVKGALKAGLSNTFSGLKTFFGSRLTQASAGLTGVGVGAKFAGVDNDVTNTMGTLGKTGLLFSGAGIFFQNLMKANSRFGVSNNPLHAAFTLGGVSGVTNSASDLSETYSNFKSGKTGGFKSFLKALPEVADLGISALMLSSASHLKPNIGKTHIPGPVRQNIKNNSNKVEINQNAEQSPKFEILSEPSTKPNLIKSDGPATPRNPYEAFILNNQLKAATKYYKEFGKPYKNSKKSKPVEPVPTTEPALETAKPPEPSETTPTTEPVSEVKPETTQETAKPDTQVKNETRTADEVRKFEKENEIAEDIEPKPEEKPEEKPKEEPKEEPRPEEKPEENPKEKPKPKPKPKEDPKPKEEPRPEEKPKEKPKENKKEDKKEEPKEEKLTAKQKATAAALGALGSLFGGNGDSRGGFAQGFSNSLGHGLPEQSAPSYERTQTNLHFISEMGM